MKLKKVITTFVATVTMLSSATAISTMVSANAYEKANESTWQTGFLNKQYYKQINYWENKNQLWVGTLAYLCNPVRWNKTGTSVTVAAQQGWSCGKTDSRSYASALGMSVTCEGVGVSTSNTYSVSNSLTITKSQSQTYSATLTKSDPTGYYVWEARNKFYRFITDLYWRPNTRSGWSFQERGKAVSFTAKNPYIELVRTNNNPW